jgi:hypothetical protein
MRRILVIIGLITVLVGAGYVVRVWNSWHVNARTSKLNVDVDNLFAALQQYKENIGAYPSGASNSELAKVLKGKNPKNVIILVGHKLELNEKGEFIDPWGTALRVYFSDSGVLIRSAGPNKRFDDSTTVESDDYIRSN